MIWIDYQEALELRESIINAAQRLLKSQFPNLEGLGLTFEKPPCTDWVNNYIQILHCRGNNWIAISTIGCDNAKIHAYDSLYSNVDINIEQSIQKIYSSDISISLPSVQKQSGFKDWFICHSYCNTFSLHN